MRKLFVSFVVLLVFTIFSVSVANRASAASLRYFGVYQTDANGDVSFKYKGAFQYFICASDLPWIKGNPNPNDWDKQVLTNWLPTWKGEKLLVPRTYQYYHKLVYGYSISQVLYLVSIY